MAHLGLFLFTIFIAMLTFPTAFSLNCWECSSQHHKHCDYFHPAKIVDEYSLDRYVKCSTKCLRMKTRESLFGEAVVLRSCADDADISEEKCKNIPPDAKLEYCDVCDTDGCNSALQYGPMTLLIVFCLIKLFTIARVY